jgi:uroporphyrinogen-III synthase
MSADRTLRVALPETRHLDVLANLLERRGVEVRRCPMIAIKDAPHRDQVVAWIERFCAGTMDYLIVYTGEGIERLISFAESADLKDRFVETLAATPLITRGPKPARVLRSLGIRPQFPALKPTTDGIIETLEQMDIKDRRIGIQLYGAEPLPALVEYLLERGATSDSVAPYIYATEADDRAVEALIGEIAAGDVDAIAFTSKSQVERLHKIAGGIHPGGLPDLLQTVIVAAVGPVAAAELTKLGVRVDVVPESDYFMKPMVTALMNRLEA